jgi:hypothetical protein
MDQANGRMPSVGRVQRFIRIPANTPLARDSEGKIFPVAHGDPQTVGYTPTELLLCLDDGVSVDDAMDWRSR